ncbi:hypothetical protein GC174_14935 [bacterium]|nr:hypothetical protein [bacterium]
MSELAAIRKKMAEEQADLVALLLAAEKPDTSFDRRQIELYSNTLKKKRLKALKSAWPVFNQIDRHEAMEAYLVRRPSTPKYHHGLLDGRLFLRFLADREELGAELRQHLIDFDRRYRLSGRRLMPRERFEQHFYEWCLIWSRRKLR